MTSSRAGAPAAWGTPRSLRTDADRLTLEFAGVAVEVVSSDPGALEWLAEFLDPWWRPSRRGAHWRVRVTVSASGYRTAVQGRPARAEERYCFLFDQQVLPLPAWDAEGRTFVDDAERSLCFTIAEGEVEVVADPATKRWRFPLLWILTEIAGAHLRRRCLDLHAAAVAGDDGAVVIAGPKLSGKTTLALHLLASGARWVGNDRVLLDGVGAATRVLGVPSAVKIRPDAAPRYPELLGISAVGRPYLLSEAELAVAERACGPATEFDLAFTPVQVATRLAADHVVDRAAEAPLYAFVFPRVSADVQGWEVEPLSTGEIATALAGCVYGGGRPPGRATPFEALAGGAHMPTAEQIAAAARNAPGYRILLGPTAYDDPDLAAWVLGSAIAR